LLIPALDQPGCHFRLLPGGSPTDHDNYRQEMVVLPENKGVPRLPFTGY
jgi:hypothetical protein